MKLPDQVFYIIKMDSESANKRLSPTSIRAKQILRSVVSNVPGDRHSERMIDAKLFDTALSAISHAEQGEVVYKVEAQYTVTAKVEVVEEEMQGVSYEVIPK